MHPCDFDHNVDAASRTVRARGAQEADIDRVVEEVESHLLVAVEEEGAETDEHVARVVAAFGSPADICLAYRASGIRVIDPATANATDARNILMDTPSTRASRLRIADLMNFSQILRNLARNPGFAAVTIATLALGIAANAVILSVVNGVLLQPLPLPDARPPAKKALVMRPPTMTAVPTTLNVSSFISVMSSLRNFRS